jgi:type IV pilus assembly protein PilA
MKRQHGFSLVELMVTLAVMGTLAVMAVGSFSSYNSRAQVAEAFTVAETLQGDFKALYADDGKTPPQSLADMYGAGAAATATQHVGRYIASANLDGGVLVLTYGLSAAGDLDGSVLTLEPYETVTGSLLWRCGTAPAPTDGLGAPLNVAGTVAGSPITGTASVTTVPNELLPRSCKTP